MRVCVCACARARVCVCVCSASSGGLGLGAEPQAGLLAGRFARGMARVLRWRGFPGWVTRVHGWSQRFAGVCGLLFGFVLSFSFSHLLFLIR